MSSAMKKKNTGKLSNMRQADYNKADEPDGE
jgi:hypothetical protein